jgi:hypothetical protein
MADVGHPLQLGLFRRGNPLRGQKKNRSLAEKLEAARETWAALGSFASLRMTLLNTLLRKTPVVEKAHVDATSQ